MELRKALNILMIISGIIYISLSFTSLKKYKNKISNQYSNIEKINLSWAYYLIIGILIIWICVVTKNDILIFASVAVFVLIAAYFGINKAGILDISELENNVLEKIQPENKEVPVKYQNSSLSDENTQLIYKKLVHKMESEKLFTDPELNLNLVSSLLEVHPNLLSQIINTVENKNFYDYVNTYRIKEFKRLAVLPENEKFTILSLAFESGFNSKTSFNRNFKKYENKSPREFLKEQNLDLK
ncbi:helix-turn-helix domain-containing protein [Epilithonimonas sp.]|uniref:helix-turn-helix domain-containing protein n=1 Tax=Epilithonimonas sp. TaxID=2894511 RepID=UPI00289F47A5|nr:helix-turn-helix domain-containing protein [Epilithonimonas sp.]